MSNMNVGGNSPLQPPSQLWGQRRMTPPQPAASQPAPAVSSQPATPLMPNLPPIGRSMPVLPLVNPTTPGQPAMTPGQIAGNQPAQQPGLGGQLSQLRSMIKSADDRLLTYYNVKLVKNDSGQITGYQLNGQNVSPQDLQRHLLPQAGILHQQITDLKKEIDQTFLNFRSQVQQQFPAMAPTEQTSVKIQLQAVQVVYESFVNRLSQVDGLIK